MDEPIISLRDVGVQFSRNRRRHRSVRELLIKGRTGTRPDEFWPFRHVSFDIHRGGGHLSFGQGLHFCLGSALARMQARVALEEVLKRWPDWEVDYDNAAKAHTASVRGWAKLPVTLG